MVNIKYCLSLLADDCIDINIYIDTIEMTGVFFGYWLMLCMCQNVIYVLYHLRYIMCESSKIVSSQQLTEYTTNLVMRMG